MASLTTINQVLKAVPESSVSDWGPSLIVSEKARKCRISSSCGRSSSLENASEKGSERPSSSCDALSDLNAKMDQVLQLMDNLLGPGPGLPAMLESFLSVTERLDKSVTLIDQMMQRRSSHGDALVRSESDSILQDQREQERRMLDWASEALAATSHLREQLQTETAEAPQVLCGKQKTPPPRRHLLLSADPLPAASQHPRRRPLSPQVPAASQRATDPPARGQSSSCLASTFRAAALQQILPTPPSLPNIPAAVHPAPVQVQRLSSVPAARPFAPMHAQPRGYSSPAMPSAGPMRAAQSLPEPASSSPSWVGSNSGSCRGLGEDDTGLVRSVRAGAVQSLPQRLQGEVVPLETRRREHNQRLMSNARAPSVRASQEAPPPLEVVCGETPATVRAMQTARKSSWLATVTSHEEDLDVWEAMESRLPVTTQRLKQRLTAAIETATATRRIVGHAWLTALSPAHKLLLLGATLRPRQQATSRCGSVLLAAQRATQMAVGAAILASAAWLLATPFQAALSRRLLGAAVLLALPLSWWAARRHRQNRGHLYQFGRANDFIEKWDSQSATSAFCSMLLLLAAVAVQISDESTPRRPYDVVAFAFASLGLVVVVHGIVSSCLGLILFIDSYCHTIGEKNVHAAMEQWNVVQASTRDFGETLQTTIALLLCTFISCTVALVVDAKRDAKVMVLPVLPSAVLLVAIARILVVASRVTEKCSKVSSFVNSLEGFDRGRQHLVEYIRSSGAGFYIFEICFTGTIAWRCFYSSATLAFLGSQIPATLGSIEG